MRIIAEIMRIIIIFSILGMVFTTILRYVYQSLGGLEYSWIGSLGILLLLFVFYRNKWQFNGWYSGEGRKKLPKKITSFLIGISSVLLVLPLVVHYFL